MCTRHLALALILASSASCRTTPDPGPPTIPGGDAAAAAEPGAEPSPEASGPCPDAAACNAAGREAIDAKDETRARPLLEHGCSLGSGEACSALSLLLDDEPGEALRTMRKACELDAFDGCANAAERLREQDPAGAVPLYTKACRGYASGDAGGFKVGLACTRGAITAYAAEDYAAAHELGALACTDEIRDRCGLLGVLFAQGLGTEQDVGEAKRFLEMGCEAQDQEACDNARKLDSAIASAGSRASSGSGASSSGLDVPDANITMGSVTVDGVTLEQLQCRTEGGGLGMLMAGPVLAKTIASRKGRLAKCTKEGTARVRWTASGGRITEIEVEAASRNIEKCVARVLEGAKSPNAGTCAVTIPLGE